MKATVQLLPSGHLAQQTPLGQEPVMLGISSLLDLGRAQFGQLPFGRQGATRGLLLESFHVSKSAPDKKGPFRLA